MEPKGHDGKAGGHIEVLEGSASAWAARTLPTGPDQVHHSGEEKIVAKFWQQTACRALRSEAAIVEKAVDSACTVLLEPTNMLDFLVSREASELMVRGYKGADVSKALGQGGLHMWCIATHGERPPGFSGYYWASVAYCMDQLNSALFSLNPPIWRDKMRLVLCHPTDGASALVRFGGGDATWMPIRFSDLTAHWYVRTVVGRTEAVTRRVGLLYEAFYEQNGGAPSEYTGGEQGDELLGRLRTAALGTGGAHANGTSVAGNAHPTAHAAPASVPEPDAHGVDRRRDHDQHEGRRDARRRRRTTDTGGGMAASLRRARGMSTRDLVTEIWKAHGDTRAWCALDDTRWATGGMVLERHVVEALLGDLGQPIYDRMAEFDTALRPGDHHLAGEHSLARFSEGQHALLADTNAAQCARSSLTARRMGEPNRLGLRSSLGQWDELYGEDGGTYTGDTHRYELTAAGRVHVFDFMRVAWGGDDDGARLRSIWQRGPALQAPKWEKDGVPAGSVVSHVMTTDPRLRTQLRTWTEPECDLRLEEVYASVQYMVSRAHAAPNTVALLAAPASSKSRYLQNRQRTSDATVKERDEVYSGVHGVTFLDSIDCASEWMSNFKAAAVRQVGAYERPASGERTVCESPWTVVAAAIMFYLNSQIDRQDFLYVLNHIRTRGWLTDRVVAVHSHAIDSARLMRARLRVCDRHLTDDLIVGSQAGVLILCDALADTAVQVRHVCGAITADSYVHVYASVDRAVSDLMGGGGDTAAACAGHSTRGSSAGARAESESVKGASARHCDHTRFSSVKCTEEAFYAVARVASKQGVVRLRRDERFYQMNGKGHAGRTWSDGVGLLARARPAGARKRRDNARTTKTRGSRVDGRRRASAGATRGDSSDDADGASEDEGSDEGDLDDPSFEEDESELDYSLASTIQGAEDATMFYEDAELAQHMEVRGPKRGQDRQHGRPIPAAAWHAHRCRAGATAAASDAMDDHEGCVYPDEHHGGDALAKLYFDWETNLKAVKPGLKGNAKKMSVRELHDKMHMPWDGNCRVCKSAGATFKRTVKEIDPYIETRECAVFHADTWVVDTRSRFGNKYLMVMRDASTGLLDGIPYASRDELVGKVKKWIDLHRRHEHYNKWEWPFCQEIKLDCAKEQGPDSSLWKEMCESFDPVVICRHTDPQSEGNANGVAEISVRKMEVTVRSWLRARSMEPYMWEDCVKAIRHISNWMPRRTDLRSTGGDAASPLEKATKSQIDRRMIMYWVKCFEMTGTLCMVLQRRQAKGSSMAEDRWRFGVVLGPLDTDPGLLRFYDPQVGMGTTFLSKHYMVIKTPLGVPVHAYLGIEPLDGHKRSRPRIGDYKENQEVAVIRLDREKLWAGEQGLPDMTPEARAEHLVRVRNVARPSVLIVDQEFNHWSPGEPEPDGSPTWVMQGPLLEQLQAAGALQSEKVVQPEPEGETQTTEREAQAHAERLVRDDPMRYVGHMFYRDFDGDLYKGQVKLYKKRLKLWKVKYDQSDEYVKDPDMGVEEFDVEDMVRFVVRGMDRPQLQGPEPETPDNFVPTAPNPYEAQPGHAQPNWLKRHVADMPTIVTKENWTFEDVCRRLPIDAAQHVLYSRWLGSTAFGPLATNTLERDDRLGVEYHAPFNRSGAWGRAQTSLQKGTSFPVPTGRRWESMVAEHERKYERESEAATVEALVAEGMRAAQALERGTPRDQEGPASAASAAAAGGGDHDHDIVSSSEYCQEDRADDASMERYHQQQRGNPQQEAVAARASVARGTEAPARISTHVAEANLAENAAFDLHDRGWRQRFGVGVTTAAAATPETGPPNTAPGTEPATEGLTEPEPSTTKGAEYSAKKGLRKVLTDWPLWDLREYEKDGRVQAPKTISEARKRPDWPRWKDAIEVEYEALETMGVFIHGVTRQQAMELYGVTTSAIPLACILKIAWATDGVTIEKYKARRILLGSGRWARKGIHYHETWAATPDFAITRMVEAIAAKKKWKRRAFDVAVAFVQGMLKRGEWILVRYEPEFITRDNNGNEMFCIAIKPLYGLASSPRHWAIARDSWFMKEFNQNGWSLRLCLYEPCLYVFVSPAGKPVLMVIHVDDNLIAGPEDADLKYIRDRTDGRFAVKDVDPNELIGVRRTTLPDGSVLFTQEGFVKHLKARFSKYCGTRKRATPFPANEMLVRADVGKLPAKKIHEEVSRRGLRSLVGGLMWIQRMTSPYLGPGLNQLCKCVSASSERAWDCAIWLLEYADQHKHIGIRFGGEGGVLEPICFYDSGGVPDPHDSKSQHGHFVLCNGGPVLYGTWKHKHSCHAGTMGKELMACAHATKAACYARYVLIDIGAIARDAPPTWMMGDNLNAVEHSSELKMTANMRHVLECYMLSRERCLKGDTLPVWIEGVHNPADPISKPCTREICERHSDMVHGFTDVAYQLPPTAKKAAGMGVEYPVDMESIKRHEDELG